MHVEFTITIGQVLTICSVVGGFGSILAYFRRMERRLDFFLVEHEMLMSDLAIRMGKRLTDFPTRSGARKI